MAVLTATFESGVDGATISAADTGSLTAWDNVVTVADGTLAYDSTHAYQALAAKVATGVTAGAPHFDWTTAFGTQTDHYGRAYIYFTASPGASRRIIRGRQTASTTFSIDVRTDGKINLLDSAGTIQATSTTTISFGQWVRIEWHVINSATVGQIEVKLFSYNPDATNPTETVATATNLNTLANQNQIQFGNLNSQANATAYWFDNIVANDVAYPGPFITPVLPPLAPASIYGRGAA